MSMGIGEKIKWYRVDRGLTLAEVETRAGLADGNLSRIERGKQWLTEAKLHAIAAALHVHPAELFIDEKFQPSENASEKSRHEYSKEDQDWLSLKNFLGSDDIKEFSKIIKDRQARNVKLMRELDRSAIESTEKKQEYTSEEFVRSEPKKQATGSL